MPSPQSFLDNLENLRLVMSVALEYAQTNREEFTRHATSSHMRQCERSITQIRTFAEQLDRELIALEKVIANVRVIHLHENRVERVD